MKFLQGFYFSVSVLLHVMDSLIAGSGCRNGGHIGNFGLDGCLSQVAVIVGAFLADRRVNNQVDLAVGDHIQNIGPPLIYLVHVFCFYACFLDQAAGFSRGQDFKSAVRKTAGNLYDLVLVPAVDGDQDSAGKRKP